MGDEKMIEETETQNNKTANREELETIEISVKLPLKVISFLHDLAKFANTDIEELLETELTQIIKDFYTGGFFESWIKKAFKNRGVSEYFEVTA